MGIDKFVCVFLAFNANAPADAPDQYLALMESTTEGISIQNNRSSFLVDSFTDQNNKVIKPADNQFITTPERLQEQANAGESALSDNTRETFALGKPRSEVEAQYQERVKALEAIENAHSGRDAQFCEFNGM